VPASLSPLAFLRGVDDAVGSLAGRDWIINRPQRILLFVVDHDCMGVVESPSSNSSPIAMAAPNTATA
jgi:hypothetical protein